MIQSEAECKYDWLPFYISKAPQNFIVSNLLFFKLEHRNYFLWAGVFVSKNRKSTKKQNKKKTSKHCSFVFQRACVFFFIFLLLFFFSAFTKNPHVFPQYVFFFFASFVNPKQQCPLVVHKLTSRTSVGVEDWSSSSRPFPLGPLCVCWCCCCCCLPSRRLLNNTRSICSWHSLRTSCNIGKKGRGR